jgi:hypothetical protein
MLYSIPFRAFCRECALAVSGKGCIRRRRLRRGQARRRRHGGSRLRERGPPGDSGDGLPPPARRSGKLFRGRHP